MTELEALDTAHGLLTLNSQASAEMLALLDELRRRAIDHVRRGRLPLALAATDDPTIYSVSARGLVSEWRYAGIGGKIFSALFASTGEWIDLASVGSSRPLAAWNMSMARARESLALANPELAEALVSTRRQDRHGVKLRTTGGTVEARLLLRGSLRAAP